MGVGVGVVGFSKKEEENRAEHKLLKTLLVHANTCICLIKLEEKLPTF